MENINQLPNHVAIIMDGNGRWAQQHHLPRLKGHQAGVDNIRPVLEYLDHCQIKYVTLYGFSTENWNRPQDEIGGLFSLLEEKIDKEALELHKRGTKIRHLGRLYELPQSLQQALSRTVELTKDNTGMVLAFAFNYGGRAEIVDTTRRIITEGISPEKIDEKLFNSYLYTAGLPDVDLLIRTGGELRTSNFLIWQTAYSEYYFTEVLWPDLDKEELEKALIAYSQRQRRFGGLQS